MYSQYVASRVVEYSSMAPVNKTFPSDTHSVMASVKECLRICDDMERAAKRDRHSPKKANMALEMAVARYANRNSHLDLMAEGAVITDKGVQVGAKDPESAKEQIEGAKDLKRRYAAFQSVYGNSLDSFLRGHYGLRETELSGHVYGNSEALGDTTLAAVYGDDKSKVLMANSNYWKGIKGTAAEALILSHETIHRYNVQSEQATDTLGFMYWSDMAKNARTPKGKEIYQKIADEFYSRATTGKADIDYLKTISLDDLKEEFLATGNTDYLERKGEDGKEKKADSYGRNNVVSYDAFKRGSSKVYGRNNSGYNSNYKEDRHYFNRRDQAEAERQAAQANGSGSIDDILDEAA